MKAQKAAMKARNSSPNRIRELRRARQISAERLGKLCGTSQQQIQRLETGERRLTQDWMEIIARALRVAPADLLPSGPPKAAKADIIEVDLGIPSAKTALSQRKIGIYKVCSDAVSAAGLTKGSVITIDHSPVALESIATGSVVLIEITREDGVTTRLLRQFVAPRLIITNAAVGAPEFILLDDPVLRPVIVGTVIHE